MTATMLKALNNPLRREVLRVLHRSSEPMSAVQMTKTVKGTGNKIFNHLKVLEKFEMVTLVDVKRVRGAKENLYESEVASNILVDAILAQTEKEDWHVRR
jgi:DNA-binding transcriptional ArsR family regulator